MKNLDYLNSYRKKNEETSETMLFEIPITKNVSYQVEVCSFLDWNQVSVGMKNQKEKRMYLPTWHDMYCINRLFFDPKEVILEFISKENSTDFKRSLWQPKTKEFRFPPLDEEEKEPLSHEIIKTRKKQYMKIEMFQTANFQVITLEACNKFGEMVNRYPFLEEMHLIKDSYFDNDEILFQIHHQEEFPSSKKNEKRYMLCLYKPLGKDFLVPKSSNEVIQKKGKSLVKKR